MSAEESGSGSEAEAYLEDAGTDDGEDNEDFGVDAGLELDGAEEGSDSEEVGHSHVRGRRFTVRPFSFLGGGYI
jgi:hypothetical protein